MTHWNHNEANAGLSWCSFCRRFVTEYHTCYTGGY